MTRAGFVKVRSIYPDVTAATKAQELCDACISPINIARVVPI